MHTLKCVAYHLGLLLRKIWGYCKPRNTAAGATALLGALLLLATMTVVGVMWKPKPMISSWMGGLGLLLVMATAAACARRIFRLGKERPFLAGC
ncbi:MAG: hypothetical protein HZA90_01375 [Verrucomicrobia bacterium]|nr:hypothetical protein [Verrucomicrobiota bacterium]